MDPNKRTPCVEVQYLLHNSSQPNLTDIIVRLRKLSLKLLNKAVSTGALPDWCNKKQYYGNI